MNPRSDATKIETQRYRGVLKGMLAATAASQVVLNLTDPGRPATPDDAARLRDAAELLDHVLDLMGRQIPNFDPDPQPAGPEKNELLAKLRTQAVAEYRLDTRPATRHLAL